MAVYRLQENLERLRRERGNYTQQCNDEKDKMYQTESR